MGCRKLQIEDYFYKAESEQQSVASGDTLGRLKKEIQPNGEVSYKYKMWRRCGVCGGDGVNVEGTE